MKNAKIYKFLCFMLILLWAYAGISKILNFHEFQAAMSLQILPGPVKAVTAKVLPFAELALVAMLFIDNFNLIALYISIILLSMFSIYIALAVFGFFPKRPCSCGGIIEHIGWNAHLAFNLFFLALNLIAIIIFKRKEAAAL